MMIDQENRKISTEERGVLLAVPRQFRFGTIENNHGVARLQKKVRPHTPNAGKKMERLRDSINAMKKHRYIRKMLLEEKTHPQKRADGVPIGRMMANTEHTLCLFDQRQCLLCIVCADHRRKIRGYVE